MFTVIYSFKILPGMDSEFISSWSEVTENIYRNEGSLGSRLHKEKDGHYLAYAQWPDKAQWENSGAADSPEAIKAREVMRSSCAEIKVLHTMDVIQDLLKDNPLR